MTRTYLTGESSRVKDLLDLVLLIDDGVAPDARLLTRVHRVFTIRASHPLPDTLTPPPASWAEPFRLMADEAGMPIREPLHAHHIVAAHWDQTRAAGSTGEM